MPDVGDDGLPPPNNTDSQAEQAASLTEPSFEYRARDEAAILAREFGPPGQLRDLREEPGLGADRPTNRADVEGRSS